MNKREKTFIEYYTSKASESYGNASKSAILSGYSTRSASTIAYRLLKKDHIKAEINRIEQAQRKDLELTKEDAIKEARENYLTAKSDAMKKYWNDIYLKLKGWDIQKQQVESSVEIREAQAELISDEVRQQINRLNNN